jgi:hypothetical protein
MTGADVDLLHAIRTGKRKIKFSARFLPLGRLSTDDDEDLLAYQWWLLNPPEIDIPAYALMRSAAPKWGAKLRVSARFAPVYPGQWLYEWADLERDTFFTSDADERLLAAFAEGSQ